MGGTACCNDNISMRFLILPALMAWMAAAEPIHLEGVVRAGETFERDIGNNLVFALVPEEDQGWVIEIHPKKGGGTHNLVPDNYISCVTPPGHGPHPTEIFAWHFVSEDNQTRLTEQDEYFPRKREFDFVRNAADQEKACHELELENGPGTEDPQTGTKTFGIPGYRQPPLGKLVLLIKRVELSTLGAGKHAVLDLISFQADVDPVFSSRQASRK